MLKKQVVVDHLRSGVAGAGIAVAVFATAAAVISHHTTPVFGVTDYLQHAFGTAAKASIAIGSGFYFAHIAGFPNKSRMTTAAAGFLLATTSALSVGLTPAAFAQSPSSQTINQLSLSAAVK